MSKQLVKLLKDVNKIKQQIERELYIPKIDTKQLFPLKEDKELYREFIRATDKYFLVTLTFSPEISSRLDTYGQKIKLLECISELRSCHYYCCFEKHKSGILHSHIMISADIHDLTIYASKMIKYLSKTQFQISPAIKIDVIADKIVDKNRVYDYIWDDKPDHPLYKDIIIVI